MCRCRELPDDMYGAHVVAVPHGVEGDRPGGPGGAESGTVVEELLGSRDLCGWKSHVPLE